MLKDIKMARIVKQIQATVCLFSIVKISIFSLLFITVQSQVGLGQIRPNPQQSQEELLIRLLTNTPRAKTIAEIPAVFREAVKRIYDGSPQTQKETKFEPYLANKYFNIMELVELSRGYKLGASQNVRPMCEDGLCDAPLSSNVWNGAWTGGINTNISDSNLPIATWTNGLTPNNNSVPYNVCNIPQSAQAHHSIVPNGFDPLVTTMKTVAPGSNSGNSALRLGNSCSGWGGERVSKTFTVPANTANNPTASQLTFWYATVLQNPNHQLSDQPGFGVYLLDSNGVKINNVVDIDPSTNGNQDFIVADQNNPFFGKVSNGSILYRDWNCVTIDLSQFAGQTVTIVFANRDCAQGAHWGYSYIDNLCFGCQGTPTGSVDFKASESKDCGKDGKICFEYTIPKAPSPVTSGTINGTVQISLQRFQNGVPVGAPISSGTLNSDGTYCFSGAQLLSGITGDFDWVATANFAIPIPGTNISPKIIGGKPVGTPQTGYFEGKNNDYKKECKSCCGIGKNFVRNGDFRDTNRRFNADYPFTGHIPFLFPGTELIGDSQVAQKACNNWNVRGHNGGKCEDKDDSFLIVNGKTTQANSNPAVVWSQQVKVDGEGEYEFCAFFKDLKQCCFNQNPKITLKATIDGRVTTQNATISTSEKPCDWQQVSTKITVPAGASSVDLQILLDESVVGDGNDLAIDDISLTKKEPVPLGETDFNNEQTVIDATTYSIKSTPVKGPKSDCKYIWSAVELDNNMNPIPTTLQSWTATTGTFNYPGYTFKTGPFYWISYKAECDCMTPREDGWEIRRRPSQGVMRLPNNGFEVRKAVRRNQNPR